MTNEVLEGLSKEELIKAVRSHRQDAQIFREELISCKAELEAAKKHLDAHHSYFRINYTIIHGCYPESQGVKF